MARTRQICPIATPNSPPEELDRINEFFDTLTYQIKSRHTIISEKLDQQLAHERKITAQHSPGSLKKNDKVDTLSISSPLIAILDAIHDSFNNSKKREELIKELDLFLVKLKKHYRHSGFASSARYAFTHYFRHAIRQQKKLPNGFLLWLEAYIFKHQSSNVYGEGFNFNRWKTIDATDLLRTQRNFDEYPRKKWLSHINPFVLYKHESSDEELVPVFANSDETDSQFTIADVHRHPLALLYFLIEYNVLDISEKDYNKLRDICRTSSEDEQVEALKTLFPDLGKLIISTPRIRILSSCDESHQASAISQWLIKKLSKLKVPIEVCDENQHYATTCIEDFDGVTRVLIYTSDLPALVSNPDLYEESICEKFPVKKHAYRTSFFHVAAQTPAVAKEMQVTNFSPSTNTEAEGKEKYEVHRIVKTTHHHFELLKTASIRLLEEYLSAPHVAIDRLNNAMWLLDQIQNIPANGPSSFEAFQRRLNLAKKTALEWDGEVDKHRFSFFRRNRFGSRFIMLLDDLRERALYCQNQKHRVDFKLGELNDKRVLEAAFAARSDDDHATRYLADQLARKEEFIENTFKM